MKGSSGCRSGYVVGWQCFDEARASRTTICSAIIPGIPGAGATGSSTRYDLDQVNNALRELSSRYTCDNEREGCDSTGGDSETEQTVCSCCTCACVKSFQVIGRWEARWNGKTRQSRGDSERDHSREERDLPRIISTSSHTWWQGDISTNSDDDKSDIFRELIWYRRLDGRTALGHYKLGGATPSISFRHMLQRLSESSSIARELIDILEGMQPDGGPTTLSIQTDSNENQPMSSDYPGASLVSHLLGKLKHHSLTAITLASRFHSDPIVVSQIPLLEVLYLLIRRLRMRSSKCSFEAREVRTRKDLLLVSKIGSASVDGIAGVLLAFTFVNIPNHVLGLVESVWLSIHVRLLRENISWLETFPVGFKLNVPLTTNMGREILLVVSTYESVLALAFGHSSVQLFLVRMLGLIGALFGFTMVSALVFDTIRLATLHIKIISGTFCKMFRLLLHTQSSLWKLFRGKKLNPLRHRTDTFEYDSMQLLLGTMLFTICLFLFTTLLVYYAFFTTVTLSVAGCGVLVWIVHILILRLPLAEYLVRVVCPHRFPKTVYFSHHSGDNVDGIHISTLESVPLPKGKVFATAYGPPFSRFFSKLPQFIGELITGRPTKIIETCLESTTQHNVIFK